MCAQARNICFKAFDNRSRSKHLKPKKLWGGGGGQFDPPPPPSRPLGLKFKKPMKEYKLHAHVTNTLLEVTTGDEEC